MPKGIAVDKQGRMKTRVSMSDTNLLLTITVLVFFALYLSAVVFLGGGFTKPQNFLNILNNNASLIVLSCGMSIVMITGGIDISVGAVTSLVCMVSAVNLEQQGGSILTVILIRFILVSKSATIIIMLTILGPSAASIGLSPFIVGILVYTAELCWFVPYQNVVYATSMGCTEGKLSHKNTIKACVAYELLSLAVCLISIPYWVMLGYI